MPPGSKSVTRSTKATDRDRDRHQLAGVCPSPGLAMARCGTRHGGSISLGRPGSLGDTLALPSRVSGGRNPPPKIYNPPTPLEQAVVPKSGLGLGISRPRAAERGGLLLAGIARVILTSGKIAGPLVHDARIAALCALHGVGGALWTSDRDFGRFPEAERAQSSWWRHGSEVALQVL